MPRDIFKNKVSKKNQLSRLSSESIHQGHHQSYPVQFPLAAALKTPAKPYSLLLRIVSWVRHEFKEGCRGVSCCSLPPQESDLVPLRSSKPRASRLVLTLKAAGRVSLSKLVQIQRLLGKSTEHCLVPLQLRETSRARAALFVMGSVFSNQAAQTPNLYILRRQFYLQLFLIFYSRGSFYDKQRN